MLVKKKPGIQAVLATTSRYNDSWITVCALIIYIS